MFLKLTSNQGEEILVNSANITYIKECMSFEAKKQSAVKVYSETVPIIVKEPFNLIKEMIKNEIVNFNSQS